MSAYSKVYLIFDALDECTDEGRHPFLIEIFQLQAETKVDFFATSRKIPKITKAFKETTTLEIRAAGEDILTYTNGQMVGFPNCVLNDLALQKEIRQNIVETVDGMWVIYDVSESDRGG